jgi:hypothetical protein
MVATIMGRLLDMVDTSNALRVTAKVKAELSHQSVPVEFADIFRNIGEMAFTKLSTTTSYITYNPRLVSFSQNWDDIKESLTTDPPSHLLAYMTRMKPNLGATRRGPNPGGVWALRFSTATCH